ncbi:isoprenylcysteine carboxyl methyltransferase [Paenibacillus sp. FSL R5-0345]|uniref:methyltransferase family protein n=1 Tax=Paenibacillus sp. FSL R5-0345 TaxID=1536770 RepID=UPI0004F82718|nr:isoprenylcysteine carboxylmethyltransferase family protein [Paenibacillus sp. FSL R5-0345]AIQ36707.1 isoprenylcysteine carboxyl methyltransferase [Paenibacillus sp. FSL R5-0345]
MNNLKNILSLILFCIFLISYLMKLVILYKKNHIKGNVLAKGKKLAKIHYTELFVKITTFVWGATWFAFSLAESYIVTLVGEQFDNPVIHFFGVGVAALGCFIFIQAMIAMRTSWRVGIDKTTVTKLITNGIYKFSRNAAFVGFDLMFLGLYLMYPNLLTLIIFLLNIIAIHLLILQEEQHLKSVFGAEYIKYCNRTPRYILF